MPSVRLSSMNLPSHFLVGTYRISAMYWFSSFHLIFERKPLQSFRQYLLQNQTLFPASAIWSDVQQFVCDCTGSFVRSHFGVRVRENMAKRSRFVCVARIRAADERCERVYHGCIPFICHLSVIVSRINFFNSPFVP